MHTAACLLAAVSCICCMAWLGIQIPSPALYFLQILCSHMSIQQNPQHPLTDLPRSVSCLLTHLCAWNPLVLLPVSWRLSVRNPPVLFPVPNDSSPYSKSPCSSAHSHSPHSTQGVQITKNELLNVNLVPLSLLRRSFNPACTLYAVIIRIVPHCWYHKILLLCDK